MPLAWSPPPRTVVVFSLDTVVPGYHPSIVPAGGITIDQQATSLKAAHERFGLKNREHGFHKLRPDDRRWPAILQGTAAGDVRLKCLWLEEAAGDSDDPHAWFELASSSLEFHGPARVPENRHFLWNYQYFASQRFVDCVRDHGLTGLQSLPLPEPFATMKPGKLVWHQVFATNAIGRGLDHPLLDIEVHEARLFAGRKALDPARRWGEPLADGTALRRDVDIEHARVREFIRLKPPHFRVAGMPRFVREFTPQSDFAYFGWGWDDGLTLRKMDRQVLCNARARRVLIESGLMKRGDFEVRTTVPERVAAAQGVRVLDRTVQLPLPGPLITAAQLDSERTRRETLSAMVTPKRSVSAEFVTTSKALMALSTRLENGNTHWKPMSTIELNEVQSSPLFPLAPKAWRTLLPLLPREVAGDLDGERFELLIVKPAWNTWTAEEDDDRPASDRPSPKDLVLAESPYGDWYSVRIRGATSPADARVTHWDHETTSISEEWPSIAAFVARLIEAAEASRES